VGNGPWKKLTLAKTLVVEVPADAADKCFDGLRGRRSCRASNGRRRADAAMGRSAVLAAAAVPPRRRRRRPAVGSTCCCCCRCCVAALGAGCCCRGGSGRRLCCSSSGGGREALARSCHFSSAVATEKKGEASERKKIEGSHFPSGGKKKNREHSGASTFLLCSLSAFLRAPVSVPLASFPPLLSPQHHNEKNVVARRRQAQPGQPHRRGHARGARVAARPLRRRLAPRAAVAEGLWPQGRARARVVRARRQA